MIIIDALSSDTILRGKSYTYRIVKVLGQGSFGITYLATIVDEEMKKLGVETHVTIKEFFMDKINGREQSTVTVGTQKGLYGEYKSKFLREAKNLAKMDNPNVVHVLETFEANNTVYYVMEYLDGGSLDEYISNRGRLTMDKTIPIIIEIGSALSYMHQHLMLHLDLKPSNIMLKNGANAVLIDFGLSKQYDEEGMPESSTKVGAGTPGYAPIEQANYREGRDFPVTMDIYALGGTMYKMLTGTRPPEASEILNEGFPADDLFQYNINQQVVDIIKKAMSPLKRNRYQSVKEMLDALKTIPVDKVEENKTLEIADSKVIPNNSKAGLIRLNAATTIIEFTDLNYDIIITPKKISVAIKNKMGETSSHSFFFSMSRFSALLNQINGLHLQQLPMRNMAHEVECSLSAFDSNGQYVDASSGNGGKFCLVGEKSKLIGVMEQYFSISQVGTQQTNFKGEETSSSTGEKMLKWISVCLALVFFVFILIVIFGQLGKMDNYNAEDMNSNNTNCPDNSHPHYIDLGLPSGTKWACCNLGASSPSEQGDTIDISSFDFDAIVSILPNSMDFEELDKECTKEDNRSGTKFIGPNGNNIYIEFEHDRIKKGIKIDDTLFDIEHSEKTRKGVKDGNYEYIHNNYIAFNKGEKTTVSSWNRTLPIDADEEYYFIRPVQR